MTQPAWVSPIKIDRDLYERCARAARASFSPEGGFAESVTPGARPLVAYAIGYAGCIDAIVAKLQQDVAHAREPFGEFPGARAAVRAVYQQAPPGNLAGQMPWLGFAELTLAAEAMGGGVPESQVPLPSAVALREMREMVWRHQLKAEDLPPDQQDLAGGILFSTSRQPLPTWQAARPLAFIATMLGDERLTEDKEVPAELSRLLSSLRFLRQLTAGEAEGHMYASPEQAMGGVRASLFDQRMPPEATALTLITVCETLQSLEKIKRRPQAPPPDPRAPP